MAFYSFLWIRSDFCAIKQILTMPHSFSASSTPTYSKKLAKPSFSQRSSHQSMVTMLPNHCRNKQHTHKQYDTKVPWKYPSGLKINSLTCRLLSRFASTCTAETKYWLVPLLGPKSLNNSNCYTFKLKNKSLLICINAPLQSQNIITLHNITLLVYHYYYYYIEMLLPVATQQPH